MLIFTPNQLIEGTTLTASLVTLYTVPSTNKSTIVKEIILCNTDTVPRSVNMNFIKLAGTAGVNNTILPGWVLQPKETKFINLSTSLPPGSFIQVSASSAGVVSINASGVDVT